jgi:hypothetical protein
VVAVSLVFLGFTAKVVGRKGKHIAEAKRGVRCEVAVVGDASMGSRGGSEIESEVGMELCKMVECRRVLKDGEESVDDASSKLEVPV